MATPHPLDNLTEQEERILTTLRELGRDPTPFLDELDFELRSLVEAVMDTAKKGSITVKFAVAPAGSKQVKLGYEIKPTLPRLVQPPQFFYADDDAHLHRDDPDQTALDFPKVNTAPAPVRDTTTDAPAIRKVV